MNIHQQVQSFFKESREKGYVIFFPTGVGSDVSQMVTLSAPLGTVGALEIPGDAGEAAVRKTHELHLEIGTNTTTSATWMRRTAFQQKYPEDQYGKYWEAASEEVFTRGIQIPLDVIAKAENGRSAWVGLSAGPIDSTDKPTLDFDEAFLKATHYRTYSIAAAAGAHFIAAETFPSYFEAKIALDAASQVYKETGVPFALSLKTDGKGNIPDPGKNIEQIAAYAAKLEGLLYLGLNCMLPSQIEIPLIRLRKAFDGPIIISANGDENHNDSHHHQNNSPTAAKAYADYVPYWVAIGADGVGGCCGTVANPHGVALGNAINDIRQERHFNHETSGIVVPTRRTLVSFSGAHKNSSPATPSSIIAPALM